jgi:ribosomal protein S18 acetylase RimI-like enzyme
MTTIVPATVQDAAVLQTIGSLSLLQSHGHSAPSHVMQTYLCEKFSREALAAELADEQNIFCLIYHNDQPAGYSKIIYRQPLPQVPEKNITKMERLYLLQEYYSLKLGRQLLQYNIELSKTQGNAGMWLYAWKENERALRFYTRAGFKIIGDGWFRLTDDHANPNWQMLLLYEKEDGQG